MYILNHHTESVMIIITDFSLVESITQTKIHFCLGIIIIIALLSSRRAGICVVEKSIKAPQRARHPQRAKSSSRRTLYIY